MTAMDAGGGWKRSSVASGLLVRRQTPDAGDGLQGLARPATAADTLLLVGNDYTTRGRSRKELTWSLPGGRLDPGEDHRTALKREFAEETGIVVEVGALLYVNEALNPRSRIHFVSLTFIVEAVGGADVQPHIPPDEEAVAEARFVTVAAVPGLIRSPSLGEGLINYLHDPAHAPRHYVYPDYSIHYAADGSIRPLLTWPPTGAWGV